MDRVVSLVVLTLLQLCRANIPKALPEWYAANLINDPNYSPKPLTEIFSTVGVYPTNTDATTTWTTRTTPTTTEPTTRNVQTQPTESPATRQPPPAMSQITNAPENRGSPAIIWPVPQTTQPPQTVPTDPPIQSTSPIWNVNQPNWLQNRPDLGSGVWNGNNNWSQQPIQPYVPLVISPNTNSPTNRPCDNPTSSQSSIVSNVPQTQEPTTQNSASPRPIITISVRRRGHKTNVLINPSTTSSTTKSPTTTKRKRNNYEVCMESCKNKKEPICSSPKGATPINPDNLKGFASMCHMACQNNFRNQQYEKVADGRCGKLRTRIRPVGQDKLNRNELNKAQYTVVHNGDETVIEFSQLERSK
ncbi:mucin-2-like [Aricia agestis]|uniref:mucin-2-like n=1 Tax=Aricia agestis TaxID=91739 RepID=UPI001C20A5C2|nr:mucin-2-like [Aricia agestis]